MKRLIAVLFGDGKPITQTFGVRREDIGNERINLPAIGFLFLGRGVKDDADGKQVVYLIHIAMLRLHLMIDGVNGFRTTFDRELETFLLQFLFQRTDERGYIRFAFGFFRVKRVRDIFIGIVIQELQCKVLHLGLDLIQAESMRHRSVEILGLASDMSPLIRIAFFIECTE